MSSLASKKEMLLPSDRSASKNRKVSVFVRVRPLTKEEIDNGCTSLDGLLLESKEGEEHCVLGNINGFDAVLGQHSTNKEVFEKCFSDKIHSFCMHGGTASMFCYGYTGGGKTHTTIGYGGAKGLFFLGAEELLRQLEKVNISNNRKDKLFLRATVCEMYMGEVYDLLGEEKLKCKLRVDQAGGLTVGAMNTDIVDYNTRFSTLSCDHATKVTRAGLRSAAVRKSEDLEELYKTCVRQRTSGSSTTHKQSSRSHAILRLEIVTARSVTLQESINDITSELPALKNAIDNLHNQRRFANIDMTVGTGGYGQVLRSKGVLNPMQGNNAVIPLACPGDVWIKYTTADNEYALHDVEGGDTARTLVEWSERLGIDDLEVKYAMKSLNLPKEEIELKLKTINEELTRLEGIKEEMEKSFSKFSENLESLEKDSLKAFGGSMLLIDLAGADYDQRGGDAQKETAAINKSLLALKECLRSLASPTSKRPIFRNSKLTRILEDSLAPKEKNTKRKNLKSACVMLVNICPNSKLEHGTINALRYGQMYSSTAGKKSSRQKGRKLDSVGHVRGGGGPKPWQKGKSYTAKAKSGFIEVLSGSKSKK